jgi:hypothetical protein
VRNEIPIGLTVGVIREALRRERQDEVVVLVGLDNCDWHQNEMQERDHQERDHQVSCFAGSLPLRGSLAIQVASLLFVQNKPGHALLKLALKQPSSKGI